MFSGILLVQPLGFLCYSLLLCLEVTTSKACLIKFCSTALSGKPMPVLS